MKYNTKIIVVSTVLILLVGSILIFAPWLPDERVREIVRTNKNFQQQHPEGSDQANPEMYILKIPLGRFVTTYEGGWFVWFWQR